MKLNKSDLDFSLTHNHAGNGWAIVEMLEDNYCRVMSIPPKGKAWRPQAYLACGDVMKRERQAEDPSVRNSPLIDVPIGEDIGGLQTFRDALKNGTKTPVHSWFKDVIHK